MFLLATILIIAAILVVLFLGGLFVVLFGGVGLIFSLLDVLVGGLILIIPIRCIKKKKKNKEVSK